MEKHIRRGKQLTPRSPSDTFMSSRFDIDPERRKNKDFQDMVSEKKAVYIDNSQSEPVEEELTLRVPPPVKGFDISAKFTCKSKNGEIIMDPTSKYRFVWYRSRKYYLCSSNHCINKSSSQKSISEMKYQCLTCLQYGNERYSYFCCPECLAKGWKEHCL